MDLKQIIAGILIGSVLSLAGTFFIFQGRITTLEAKTFGEASQGNSKYTQTVSAYYPAHQYFHMNMQLSKCTQIVTKSAEKAGFKDINVKTSSGNYSSISAMNQEGYSFQYVCEEKKGFGYLIVSGPESKIRSDIKQIVAKEINSQKKIN